MRIFENSVLTKVNQLKACLPQLRDSDYSVFDRRETVGCIFLGYAIIYFLHSYFLWLNTMALVTWLAFKPSSRLAGLSETKKAESVTAEIRAVRTLFYGLLIDIIMIGN